MSVILIVDDHPDIRRLFSVTLDPEFEVIEAGDGVSALETIRHRHPDVVLLDVMMPGEVDGLEVLDTIKADPKTLTILVAMMTARGQVEDGEDARRRGADAYFIKPCSPLQVAQWVRRHLK